ncbi:hypothetical protein GGP86_001887 [Salinibacter ruber]|uniref:hypothetical protein n=1 Tax=Salinibacter ruber TaxID=146919 RepID=UPI0021670985|nr:hypothetical protein [Salinibacter ruber]MCS3862106.1 hypothetical protein [Salinibacter ruber]
MITHEVGKCYKMSFDDGEVIVFKFLGSGPQGPLVEVDGRQENLHSLMAGHTLKNQTVVPCQPADLSQSLGDVLDKLSRAQGSLNDIEESNVSGQESQLSSAEEEAMGARQRIAVLKGNHGAIPMSVVDAESELKDMTSSAKKIRASNDREKKTEEFREVKSNLNDAINGIGKGVDELSNLAAT